MAIGVTAPVTIDVPTLATRDIAVVDRMLVEEQITPIQNAQMVSEIQRLQAQEVTSPVYEQQIQTLVQERFTVAQQEQFQQEQVQVTQEQLQQEQQTLQEMYQQQVQQWQIQEQQLVVQQLQQELQQITQITGITPVEPITPSPTPPTPPTFPIIPPILPLFPGGVLGGGGFARGFRGGRLGYGMKYWNIPELVIATPEFLSLRKQKTVIRKEKEIPYGARLPRNRMAKMGRAKGIRL